jgi:hypothetical protein
MILSIVQHESRQYCTSVGFIITIPTDAYNTADVCQNDLHMLDRRSYHHLSIIMDLSDMHLHDGDLCVHVFMSTIIFTHTYMIC